jgi:Tfp pilus assembly protein FimT
MFSVLRNQRGYSLTELMLIVGVMGTMMAMAVPVAQDVTAAVKLGEASRMVERELQDARLRAVANNRTLRVRFNCPAAGQLRTVEVLGTGVDTAATRCSQSTYPYPAPDKDLMTRPNHDGPLRYLPSEATVTTTAIQFLPDGTAQAVSASGAALSLTSAQTITITRRNRSRTVTVNGAGKVQLNVQ